MLTITQLKEKKLKKEIEALRLIDEQKRAAEELEKKQAEAGVSWGMGEDADEETDLTVNPFASTNNEELFLDDPKKTLRGFFEREGLDIEYKVDEMSAGSYVCRIELPLDDANGRPLVAEISHKGKKKDAVHQGALEACRILDRHGLLRRANHEPRRRKQAGSSGSDDDNFFDRTGDVERKRERKLAATKTAALSHEDLLIQEKELLAKLDETLDKIKSHELAAGNARAKSANKDLDDDLDAFMTNLKYAPKTDKIEIRRLRLEVTRLEQDHVKLKKLIKISAPLNFPGLLAMSAAGAGLSPVAGSEKKLSYPLFGKRNKIQKPICTATITAPPQPVECHDAHKSDEEEIDEPEGNEVPPKRVKIEMESPANVEKPMKGPAFIPPNLKEINKNEEEIPAIAEKIIENFAQEFEVQTDDQQPSESSSLTKKRRPRQRIRDKNRENVDMEDFEQDSDKFSKWVPPENQAGDGYTSLNDKFGY